MNYHLHYGWHVLFLSPEETDQFFDPFDPSDTDMPSYLHHRGHRYIKDNVYQWLIANVGEASIAWKSEGTSRSRELLFVDKDKAMLFKLTFR